MPRYFLRVEGVNHANFYDDTDDLSTRRGGGLLLLNAVVQMREQLSSKVKLTEVATGASVGLFTFEATDEADAERQRQVVVHHFQHSSLEYDLDGKTGHVRLSHGTFVVDVEPVGEAEQQSEQRAVAGNRWRQMREPTVSLDKVWVPAAVQACEFNCIRPATEEIHLPDRMTACVSESVAQRRRYGQNARQLFYHRETGLDLRYTNEFRTIADRTRLSPDLAPTNTADKLAVFYVDGNKFGDIGREWFQSGGIVEYRTWSCALRQHHRSLLGGLLQLALADHSWQNDGAIRLETLLWGGDEILWVVPAWKGWELARWFFAQEHVVQGCSLTYGAGLVFCGVKTPIQNVIKLAHTLADTAKQQNESSSPHSLAYEVLESLDDIHGDLDEYRRKWLPEGVSPESLIFNPELLNGVWDALRTLAASDDFPMRQLYRLHKLWRNGEKFDDCERRLSANDLGDPLSTVVTAFGGSGIGHLHLLQMLPYIPSQSKEGTS